MMLQLPGVEFKLGCTERLRPQTKGTPFRLQTAFAAFANVYGVVWHLQTSQKNKDFLYVILYVNLPRSKNSPKKGAYGTPDYHVVARRSTDEACSGLTAQFGRDTVRCTEYGRRRELVETSKYLMSTNTPTVERIFFGFPELRRYEGTGT